MTHYVESIEISDSIDQLAPVAILTILPVHTGEVVRPHAVLQELNLYSMDDLPRPNTVYDDIQISVDGGSLTSLLHARKLYVVDVSEQQVTDGVAYTLTLVGDDPDGRYNRKCTQVYPSPIAVDGLGSTTYNKETQNTQGGDGPSAGALAKSLDVFRFPYLESATTILSGPCAFQKPMSSILGLTTAYLDALPNYTMYGTMEFERVSILEALKEYTAPFNMFPHTRFFLRLRNGELYAQRASYFGTLRGRYTPLTLRSQRKTTARYDATIYDRGVLCSGGEKWEPTKPTGSRTLTGTMTERQVFTSEVQHQVFSGEDVWVEGETTYEIEIEIRKDGDGTLILLPTLADNIGQLQQGFIDDLRILSTRVVHKLERQFSKLNGLLSERAYAYTYEERVFNNGVYVQNGVQAVDCGPLISFPPQSVLVGEYLTETLFWNGKALPNKHSRTTYSWNNVGSQVANTTQNFIYMNDQWTLDNAEVKMTDPIQLTSAIVQFWNNYNQNLKSQGKRPVKQSKQPLKRWMLLNGAEVEEKKFEVDCEDATLDTTSNVFEITVPCAGKDGLLFAWGLAQRQQYLEKNRAYWEEGSFETLLDVNAMVGMPYGTATLNGIVVGVRHSITADSALTTVETRKVTV